MKNLFPFLVCTGVRVDEKLLEEILEKQNPYRQKRGGLGYGIHAVVHEIFSILPPQHVNIRINSASPLYLNKVENNRYEIIENGKSIAKVEPFKSPDWIQERLHSGKPVVQVLQQHTSRNLVGIIGQTRCPLFAKGSACSFCEMNGGEENKNRTVDEIMEALALILKHRSDYVLTFTTPLLSHEEFAAVCESLKTIHTVFPKIPLALESQPAPKYLIDKIKEAGVDTWMIPLDCYSEYAQCAYIPGKQSVLKNFYWDSLNYAVSLFGAGNVVSNLILGLEHEYYAKAAVDQIIARDVIPDLLPIRPSNNFYRETTPAFFQDMQIYLRDKMHTSGLASRMSKVRSGCAACGGCTGGLSANMFKAVK